jgi:hypothetical protein
VSAKICAYCLEPSITHLDGDELCIRHANEWVHAEGHAAAEYDADRADRGVKYGDEN